MKVTVQNNELVCSREIDETLAKKILGYPERITSLEHDLHIRHELSHSEDGKLVSNARVEFVAGCDLEKLATKLKESQTILLGQAAVWKIANKKAMKDKPENAPEVYVCLKRTDHGYEVEGNMPLEEVIQTLAQMFIKYAANKQ